MLSSMNLLQNIVIFSVPMVVISSVPIKVRTKIGTCGRGSSRSVFGRLTFFSRFFLLCCLLFSKKEQMDEKNYLVEVKVV